MIRKVVFLCLLVASSANAEWYWAGHLKLAAASTRYPSDSVYQAQYGDSEQISRLEGRLNLECQTGALRIILQDQLALIGVGSNLALYGFEDADARRAFDLTRYHQIDDNTALVNRIDRLHVSYSADDWVIRAGRQALSWGNGLAYQPMDFLNPFAPNAIDTEYKVGDDMVYGQYLMPSGDDIQAVWVVRRNPADDTIDSQHATYALKYHGFASWLEFDVLAAKHYDQTIFSFGGNRAIGDALWRFDVVVTDTDDDWVWSGVTSLSYSWQWGGHNINGGVEYFYNGFGIDDGDYSPPVLTEKSELTTRITRGELYTLGQQYLMANATVEVTPLLNITPAVFLNLNDQSALLQLSANYSVSDEMVFLASVAKPLGEKGSEYGGVESALPGRYFTQGLSVQAQLAWYF